MRPIQPRISVDIIIKYKSGIVLIKRKNPPLGWAIPGGFVEYGESLEHAAIREAKEETNLDVRLLKQLHAYSDPERDPRGHTISVVFLADGNGVLKSGDDAEHAEVFQTDNLPDMVFDHSKIISDSMPFLKDGN